MYLERREKQVEEEDMVLGLVRKISDMILERNATLGEIVTELDLLKYMLELNVTIGFRERKEQQAKNKRTA